MAKINIINNKMALFMIYEAFGEEREEWKDIQPDENGMYEINIQLNGKEINVERFIENLQRSYQKEVKRQAANLLSSEYDKMISSIHGIQESLEIHNKIFSKKVFGSTE